MSVSCKLVGRLGNQAFQLAALKAHTLRHGLNLKLPCRTENETLWPFYFTHLRGKGASFGELYTEPRFEYDPIPAKDNIVLNGYFQSAKYFDDYRKEVIEFLFPNLGINPYPYKHYIAVHVRRGDYLQFQDQFPVLPKSYYIEAMKQFPGKDFVFFSDDTAWCAQNFGEHAIYTNRDPMQSVLDMAQCAGVITSNSSFSWWVAYLSGGPCVMPKTWFGPGSGVYGRHADIYLPKAIVL